MSDGVDLLVLARLVCLPDKVLDLKTKSPKIKKIIKCPSYKEISTSSDHTSGFSFKSMTPYLDTARLKEALGRRPQEMTRHSSSSVAPGHPSHAKWSFKHLTS